MNGAQDSLAVGAPVFGDAAIGQCARDNGVLAGWATLGMLLSFIDYTRRSFDPIAQLADQFSQIQTAFAAGERIARMLKVEPQILEPEKPVHVEGGSGGALGSMGFQCSRRRCVDCDLGLRD